jgi:hypothetical protein
VSWTARLLRLNDDLFERTLSTDGKGTHKLEDVELIMVELDIDETGRILMTRWWWSL